MKTKLFYFGLIALLLPSSAFADERLSKEYAEKRTSFFKVPLSCGPFEGFGCGSAARPLLAKLERDIPGSQPWLNHGGTVLAVVWARDEMRKGGEAKVIGIGRSSNILVTTLNGDARVVAARDLTGENAWYRTSELEKLSMLEATTHSTRFADRVAARIPLDAAVRDRFQQSLRDLLFEHFRKTDGRPSFALKKQLIGLARKQLGEAGVAAFEQAIKNGSKRQPGDSV